MTPISIEVRYMEDFDFILEQINVSIHAEGKIGIRTLNILRDIGIIDLEAFCTSRNLEISYILERLGYISPPLGFLLLQMNATRFILGKKNSYDTILGLLEPTYISTFLATTIRRKDMTVHGIKILTHVNLAKHTILSARFGKKVALIMLRIHDLKKTYVAPLRGLGTDLSYVSLSNVKLSDDKIIDILPLENYKKLLMSYFNLLDLILKGIKSRILDMAKKLGEGNTDTLSTEHVIELIIRSFGIHLLSNESYARFYVDAYIELEALKMTLKKILDQIIPQSGGS